MIEYEFSDLFMQDSVNKQWILEFIKNENEDTEETYTIYNDQILDNSISLIESISSGGNIEFGRCNASSFSVTIYNHYFSLKNAKLIVKVSLNDNDPFVVGTYKVESDKPTADRRHRTIEAYDSLYSINEMDVADWYNGLTFPMTLKSFRDSFFEHVGVEQEETTLTNDALSIPKTLDTENGLSGSSVISAICQINGAFGHIGRDNVFHYIILQEIIEGLYPSDTLIPSDDLYPVEENVKANVYKNQWINAEYEDYTVSHIDGVIVLGDDGNIEASTSSDVVNPYVLENNFLLYDKSASEKETVANNLFSVIGVIYYTPANIECIANLCVEVGDSIRFNTNDKIIFTYVLERNVKGLQMLTDTIEATGDEDLSKELNSLSKQLARLRSKSKYDLEATNARITNLEVDHVTVDDLVAANGRITALDTDNALIRDTLSAAVANIGTINGTVYNQGLSILNINTDITNINTSVLNISGRIDAAEGTINTLRTSKLDASSVNASYINSKFTSSAYLNVPYANIPMCHVEHVLCDYAGRTLTFSVVGIQTAVSGNYMVLASPPPH